MPAPKEFGQRRWPRAEPAAPVKRSGHVALLLMGSIAVGGGAYALMPSENCDPGIAAASGQAGNCSPRQSSSSSLSHGSGGGGSSRANFFGGDASTGRAGGSASDAGSGHVARGGFGSFAQAFSAHFSGGG
jgi:hypothetical protein